MRIGGRVAMPGEVFDAGMYPGGLLAGQKRHGVSSHQLGVGAERSGPDHRIAPVDCDIGAGGEVQRDPRVPQQHPDLKPDFSGQLGVIGAAERRRARIEDKLEKLAVSDGIRAVRFAEVVVVLLDATIPFEKQDLTIIDLVERELATDLARLTDPTRWSAEDLRVLSNLIVTLMVGATESIVNARPESRPAILENARTQLRMMLVGALQWSSR